VPTTKIKASDSKPIKSAVSKKTVSKKPKVIIKKDSNNLIIKAISGFFSYFKNSWIELRKVRWPNRRATWGMTGAVLLFTGLFIILIVSLDTIFSQLFKLIIK